MEVRRVPRCRASSTKGSATAIQPTALRRARNEWISSEPWRWGAGIVRPRARGGIGGALQTLYRGCIGPLPAPDRRHPWMSLRHDRPDPALHGLCAVAEVDQAT